MILADVETDFILHMQAMCSETVDQETPQPRGGGGGGVLPIFSIYICAARMPLFLAIFLSLAT